VKKYGMNKVEREYGMGIAERRKSKEGKEDFV